MFQPARYKFFRLKRGIATCASVLALAGCGSVYIHDPAVLETTKGAQEAFKKADVSGTFDSEKAYLDKLIATERETIKGRILGVRDSDLMSFISPLATNTGDPAWSQMAKRIQGRLAVSVGIPENKLKDYAADLSALPFRLSIVADRDADKLTFYKQVWAEYVKDGGTDSDPCHEITNGRSKGGKTDTDKCPSSKFLGQLIV